ncbi:hypothetical protein V6N11_032242 [Hibiscus sabdariffa]|uniref:Disease resistance protein At4g27190-like leucine-rich repeats domain-containing protein n=1 Tax=Hibiscus sabdariffa TaxID=183260 RepID=A0ABR2T0V1_9ROSI
MKSRQAEFDKGHATLNKLEKACLSECVMDNYGNDKRVKMHDLIRDMVLYVTSIGSHVMVKAGMHLREIPNKKYWTEDLEMVSLMYNSISEIPADTSPMCPRLSTLLLSSNHCLRRIPDTYFMHMGILQVLDLSDTSIEVLPNSISELEKLTVLLLRGCRRLRSVPPLTRLVALKWLDLCDTRVKEIPQGMEMLINLTYLNLYTPDLEFFPFGILPKLRNLQVLITYGASKTFMIKGQELAALTKLECVSGQLCDVHDMNIFTFSIQDRGPVAYCLRVGEYPCTRIEEEKESFGNLVILSRCIVREDELVLPNDIQVLELHDCQGFASICEIFSRNCATSLKSCRMSGCGDMECAFQSPLSSPSESLELLVLRNLENLLVFYEGPAATVPDSTFTNLKRLAIHECRKIKKLFTPNMQLHRLEDLEVSYCDQIEEIIEEHSINRDSVINFPMLRSLTLRRLPNLKTIFMGVIHCDSLQVCQVFGCPKLKRLPFSLLLLPKSLERICATREWWESLEWDQPNAQTAFQHFFGTDLRCSNF